MNMKKIWTNKIGLKMNVRFISVIELVLKEQNECSIDFANRTVLLEQNEFSLNIDMMINSLIVY